MGVYMCRHAYLCSVPIDAILQVANAVHAAKEPLFDAHHILGLLQQIAVLSSHVSPDLLLNLQSQRVQALHHGERLLERGGGQVGEGGADVVANVKVIGDELVEQVYACFMKVHAWYVCVCVCVPMCVCTSVCIYLCHVCK